MIIDVQPLNPERAVDFLAFFDHHGGPAFADNPEWATCYCQFYHTPKALDWAARGGDDNRTAMAGRIAAAEMEGFLAYARGSRDEPLALFTAAGFSNIREDPTMTVVRKTLSLH